MPELLIPHQKSCAPDAEQTPDRPPPPPFDCIGVGVCAVDHLFLVARYPQANEKTEALGYGVETGGPVPTALATASWWGARCAYIGKLGNDADGDFPEAACPLRCGHQHGGARPTRFYPAGDDLGGTTHGAAQRGPQSTAALGLTLQDVSRRQVLRGRILHVDGRETQVALAATRWARRAGRVVVCDLGRLRKESELLLQQVDNAVVSSNFVRQLYGECKLATATRRLLQLGPRLAVVTAGEQVCWWATGERLFHQPAFAVEGVDTTGADDVFHGAFLFGLSRGWELPVWCVGPAPLPP